MKERLMQPVNLKELSEFSGLSVVHYSMLFRKKTGFAPIDWFNRMRIQRACELLSTSEKTVAEVAEEVGYTDAFYFTRYFKQVMGMPPRRYRDIPKG
jgi:AraC family transcriptional regulator, arabinose operon regulatory protein